jgi:prepilin-type N-terminal cleavage/methylation domain-containing protein
MTARRKRVGDNALHLHAFTLIELLVVIGIIAATAGVLGLALRDGSPTAALQSAQGIFASLLSAARSQAALNQNSAVLAVEADDKSDGFLRNIHIAVETSPGSGKWNLVSDTTLPAGIYVVPPVNTSVNGASYTTEWLQDKYQYRHSSLYAPATIEFATGTSSILYLKSVAQFSSSGKLIVSSGGDRFVLAPARRTSSSTLVFENPELVRGVVLSAYGTAILINDGTGFDN